VAGDGDARLEVDSRHMLERSQVRGGGGWHRHGAAVRLGCGSPGATAASDIDRRPHESIVTSPELAAAPSAEPVRIPATDGFPIPATLFTPAGEAPERVVLVAPATGVRRRLYDAFARSLAARGMGVVTWDWRGTGESRPERMRGFQASMSDWARRTLVSDLMDS
jgi:hypothetical protein